MHGIQDSSDAWIARDEKSPAFILADAGYDVWLGNFRGNKHSKRHVVFHEYQKEFWDFGWEELGQYDLPAFTDYILSQTNHKKLAYFGHSMGTTAAMYALTLDNQYYKERWSLIVCLAPPLSMRNVSSPLFKIFGN